jgi:probable F420-dependent oxidoreductase
MQFGISAPFRGPLATPEDIRTIAEAADRLGFHYLTVSDHIICPRSIDAKYPYSESGEFPWTADGVGDCMEQFTLMAWLAAATKKVRLLTSVAVIPHRNPLFMAKSIATMDVLSGGRISIGCGTGWMREEFEALGIEPFEKRGAVTNEYIAAMKALWTLENPSFSGEFANFSNLIFAPKPVQKPHPPLWIGGESGPAMRRVAAYGDVWYPFASNPKFRLAIPDAYRERAARVKQAVAEAGRDPSAVTLAYNSPLHLESERQMADGGRMPMTGSASDRVADIQAFADAGMQIMIVNLTANDRSQMLDRMETFAGDVMVKV